MGPAHIWGQAVRSGDVINQILQDQGRSQRSLALELGITQQTVSKRLVRDGSLHVDTLASMADALGYEVLVSPKGHRPSGAYHVDS